MEHLPSEPSSSSGNIDGECLEPRITSPTIAFSANIEDEHVAKIYCFPEEMNFKFGSASKVIQPSVDNFTSQREIESDQSIKYVTDEVRRTEDIRIAGQTIRMNETEPSKKKQNHRRRRQIPFNINDYTIPFDLPTPIQSPDIISHGESTPVNDIAFHNAPQLGSGAFGIVYDITHPEDNKRMAVKCTSFGKNGDEYIVAENEFNAIKKLDPRNCPYIIKYYRAEMTRDDNFFHSRIYMEHMDMSLAKFYGSKDFPSENSMGARELLIRRIIHDTTRALLCLEEEDLVHRDIKPDNILISRNGTFKLIDMGLCTSLSELRKTKENYMVGTLSYAPPQAAKNPIHDDMWRLGFTLLEILTGKHPYPGPEDCSRSIKLLMSWEPTFPMTVSAELKELIKHLLEKDSSARPNSFNDILKKDIIRQVTPIPSADELKIIRRILDT